jgi:hypothetical protein
VRITAPPSLDHSDHDPRAVTSLAGQLSGSTIVADAPHRGMAVGLTAAELAATIDRLSPEKRTCRRRTAGPCEEVRSHDGRLCDPDGR